MKTTTYGLAVAALLGGLALGLAGPASAESLDGAYTATMVDAGASGKQEGSTTIFTLSTCGPDCLHLQTASGSGRDFHLQGNLWTSAPDSNGCFSTIDNTTVDYVLQCPGEPNVLVGLTRNG